MEVLYRVNLYNQSLSEISANPSDFRKELNIAGEKGWELIEMKDLPGGAGFLLVFKSVQAS